MLGLRHRLARYIGLGIIRDLSDLPEQLKTFSVEQARQALSPLLGQNRGVSALILPFSVHF